MFSQRFSCDRCRQQKVRCLKNWDALTAHGGGINHLTPCERCTKADVACVYSLRQKNRRSKGKEATSPRGDDHLNQDFSSVLSSSDIAGYDFNDLVMPSLNTTMTCIGDGDAYSWGNNSELGYNNGDNRVQESSGTSSSVTRDEGKESAAAQLMNLSNRAMASIRELECAVITMPLTVNSPVVNEAFETANSLVRIINSIGLLADGTNDSSRPECRDPSERHLSTECSPIFLALACHQHVLALFRAVCDTIRKSLGPVIDGTEPQQQTLHGVGSSSAQFIMVLQLIMHLLNRISRSLRTEDRKNTDEHDLTFGSNSAEESGSLQSIVHSAQVMLRTLPDEHERLSEVIQELQAYIEEGLQ